MKGHVIHISWLVTWSVPGVWVVDEGTCYTHILVGYMEWLLVYG